LIPLTLPHLIGNEWKYVKECLDTAWISSAGSFVGRFEKAVAKYVGSSHGIACVNGTSGLHLALCLLDVSRDDLVILPNLTFVASANAIHYTGAQPLLIDVDPNTWQLDLALLETFLENETTTTLKGVRHKQSGQQIKAVMPVHVLGNMVEMQRLLTIAGRYNLPVIEDASEALGSTMNDKHAGTFGEVGIFSFNGNKIISTGGGGMIVTENEDLARKAKHLSTQAKISSDEYIHDSVGYNYRLVNVLAAIGVAQMEQLPDYVEKKRLIDRFYRTNLQGVGDIAFQKVTPDVTPNCWLFTFQTGKMLELRSFLDKNGIQTRPFWKPMNQLSMYSDCICFGKEEQANTLYSQCISIPSSVGLTQEQMQTVVDSIKSFYK